MFTDISSLLNDMHVLLNSLCYSLKSLVMQVLQCSVMDRSHLILKATDIAGILVCWRVFCLIRRMHNCTSLSTVGVVHRLSKQLVSWLDAF